MKRAQEARQNNEIFEIFKMIKRNTLIDVYYTKSKYLLCFQLEIPFLGTFGPKTHNYQFNLKFCT